MQELETNGNRDTVHFLLIIAFLIIVIAWVNYINLSTARSLTRAREVGIRKVVGASRSKLMIQFFFETFLINGIALLFTLVLIVLVIPLFSRMTGIPVNAPLLSQTWFWIAWIFLLFAGVVISGVYPVLVMSSFKPITVLHGKLGGSPKRVNLRKGLVIFQFVIAMILLAVTLTVFRQIQFMQKKNLGVDIRQTLVARAPRVRDETYGETWKTFKETLLKDPSIRKMSHVTEVPGRQIYWDAGGIHRAGEDQNKGKNYQIVGIDYDFIPLFDLILVAGRNFSLDYSSDNEGLILNETAVRIMGFESPQDAIGQQVDYWGNFFTIIGVLKDFHQQSPKEAYEPHLYRLMLTGRDIRGMFAIKIHGKEIKKTVHLIQKLYDRFFPGNPFDFFFLDDYYNQQYQADQILGKVFGVFAGLAVLITALGILGLSSFSSVQRTKEIGIRKVMGASVQNILFLLIRDFLILIGVSFCLSLPVLIFGLNRFLQRYVYRIRLEGWLFILPLLGIIIITMLTVSTHIVKSATANPARALRYE
jgi:putative ABC transport system permease protein